MRNYDFYKKIYFNSLTPTEILKFKSKTNYQKVTDVISYDNYVQLLKNSVEKHANDTTLTKYYKISNFTDSDINQMVSKVFYTNKEIKLPVWVEQFEEVFQNIDTLVTYDERNPFFQLLFPFLNYAFHKITNFISNNSLHFISESIVQQTQLDLYNHLLEISQVVFLKEFTLFRQKYNYLKNQSADTNFFYKKFVSFNLKNKFRRFAFKYPMLLRKILIKTHKHISFITKMLERLNSDRKELKSRFSIDIHKIEKIVMNMGDTHNGGSTVIINFGNDNKVVYKPSNIGVTKAYNTFLQWVNTNLNENLEAFDVIVRVDYGWLQFVKYRNCESNADVKLYYERAGILLGIAYFLNANDLHFENVIASGNCPVLIDHETIISPKLKLLSNTNGEYSNGYMGTVLETSLIPIKNLNLPYYGYGYGSSSIDSELRVTTSQIKYPNTDLMALETVAELKSSIQLNKPICDGKIENLSHYKAEFTRGFERMYNLVLREKKYLLSECSPINTFSNQTIRFINRPTKVYYKILRSLNSPNYLADAVKYGAKLEVLARAYMTINEYSPILNHEREQMLLDDVPIFYINSTGNVDNPLGEKKIELNALENIRYKIRRASVEDYEVQMVMIEESINL